LAKLIDMFLRKKPIEHTEFTAGGGGTSAKNAVSGDVPDFGAGRIALPTFLNGGGGAGGNLPRKTQIQMQMDDRTLKTATVDKLIDILADAHPDVGFAIWNFLRIGNGEFEIKVTKPDSDNDFSQGAKLVDQFLHSLKLPSATQFESSREIKKVINSLMFSVVTRGACALELVLAPSLTGVAFMAPVDPTTIVFKFENGRYVPYQSNGSLSLDIPTFFMETLDARIDEPYGRSPIMNALQTLLFQMQVLNDMKAVVHNQGYPRFDIKILEEVLLNRMPIAIRNNEEKKAEWLTNKIKEVIAMYNGLQPDDTFVHFDSIEMGTVGGGKGGGGAVIDIEKLFAVIDNQIMAGLKTLSTILGRRSTGNTESFAKLEIKLYIQGIVAIQEVVERTLSRALTLMLVMNGKQGIVNFKFKPIEIRTELEQAQFEQIALLNYAYMRDQGWIDNDGASMRAVGTPAVAEPNFDVLVKGTANPSTSNGGGANNGTTTPAVNGAAK
jgi:hypothetical protein